MGGTESEWARVPDELQQREQWLLWDASAETPRRPHWKGDFSVSWSDPDAWHSYREAVEAASERESWGIGYVCAIDNNDHPTGVYGVIDIDGGVESDGSVADWVPDLDRFADAAAYMEYSPSGEGIHIPVAGTPKPDWFSDVQFPNEDHKGVDYLTNKFCTFTGDTLGISGSTVTGVDVKPWLIESHKAITGKLPRDESVVDDGSDYDGEDSLSKSAVEDALDHLNPDVSHPMWIRLGFAVHDWDDSGRGRDVFERWSRGGEKWDSNAESQVEWIWNNASPGSDVTVGTLIHHAKEQGWQPPKRRQTRANGGVASDGGVEVQSSPTDEPAPGIEQPAELKPGALLNRLGEDPDETTLQDIRASEAAFAIDRLLEDVDDWNFLVVDDDSEDVYSYDDMDGVWKRDGERRLKQVCREAMGQANSKKVHSETIYAIQGNPNVRIERDDLGAPNATVATPNGLLDLKDKDIQPLKPKHHALNRIATSYDPAADYEGSRWMEFLENSVTPGDRDKLQEYAGYCLWHHAQPFGKALFLVGPTDSGKGTFLKAISQVIGDDNIANESLYDLLQTRWGPARLFGNMMNVRNEVTPRGLKNIQKFKEMTGGGDTLSAEYKGQDKFEFQVNQKFMFSTNQMPEVENGDGAFYNRLLFAAFPDTVPQEQQDKDLLEKLDDEREEILNWMLDGLDRLMRQTHFSNVRDREDKERIMAEHGDAIDRFASGVLEITGDADDVVHKSDLYEVFCRFNDFIGRDPVVQQTFTTSLKENDGISDGRSRRVPGEASKPHVYTGIRVSEESIKRIQADMPRHAYADEDGDGGGDQERLS